MSPSLLRLVLYLRSIQIHQQLTDGGPGVAFGAPGRDQVVVLEPLPLVSGEPEEYPGRCPQEDGRGHG